MSMPINPYLPSHTYTNTVSSTTIVTTWYKMGDLATTTLSDGITTVQAATYTFTGVSAVVPGVKYTFVVYDKSTGCSFTKEANISVPTASTLETT